MTIKILVTTVNPIKEMARITLEVQQIALSLAVWSVPIMHQTQQMLGMQQIQHRKMFPMLPKIHQSLLRPEETYIRDKMDFKQGEILWVILIQKDW